ncbi:hypothetical protein D3C76_1543890 [compost metagenome]
MNLNLLVHNRLGNSSLILFIHPVYAISFPDHPVRVLDTGDEHGNGVSIGIRKRQPVNSIQQLAVSHDLHIGYGLSIGIAENDGLAVGADNPVPLRCH